MLSTHRRAWVSWVCRLLLAGLWWCLPALTAAQPDLVIEETSLNFEAESIRLAYGVRNRGDAPTPQEFRVGIGVDCRPRPPRIEFLTIPSTLVPARPPEAVLPAFTGRTTVVGNPLPPGKTCAARVVADPDNVIPESDEGNNRIDRVLFTPEVKLRDVNVHRSNHLDTYLTLKVKNTGPAATSYSVEIRNFTRNQALVQRFMGTDVPPGSMRSHTVDTNALPTGENRLRVSARIGNVPMDEAIRRDRKDQAGGLPDLKLIDVNRHRNNQPDVFFTFKVKNVGAAISPPYRIRYVVDGGAVTRIFFATPDPLPELGRGDVRPFTLTASELMGGPGEFTLSIAVDPANGIPEENEDNNVVTRQYRKRGS